MSRVTPSRARFEILSDSSSDDEVWCYERLTTTTKHQSKNQSQDQHQDQNQHQHQSAVLRDLSVSHSQNRHSSASSVSDSTIESITHELKQLRLDTEAHQLSRVHEDWNWGNTKHRKQPGSRLARPPITANTFEVLETVLEDESRRQPESAAPSVSDSSQRFLELPAEQYSRHPLSIAARSIPSAQEQVAKHRNGDFEWVLSVRVPVSSTSSPPSHSTISSSKAHTVVKTQLFGCNLLPTQQQPEGDSCTKDRAPSTYTLLVTPLKDNEDILKGDQEAASEATMAVAELNSNPTTPTKGLSAQSSTASQRLTPASARSTKIDTNFLDASVSRSPISRPVSRIEDSLEALDELEDQLEAFDEAAHFRQILFSKEPQSANKHPPDSARSTGSVRFATPQIQKNGPKASSTVRAKAVTEPRQRAVRKSTSMIFLDAPKLKLEDKPLAQTPPKNGVMRKIASLLPPRPSAKSTKQPTVPSSELPGDAVARKIKEKREAHVSTQASVEQATRPTVASLRRTKSAKLPTRPNFELPGEAISRRKREEREAQLKAQEEEEKKRRAFKARPMRSSAVPSTVPRDTIASRARQNKVALTENTTAQKTTPNVNKRAPTINYYPNSRPPLSHTNNRPQPRGRGLQPDSSASDSSRAASSSTRSVSGKRSQISEEDAQHQKLRGHEIYQRDNSLAGQREREKREREILAKLARAEVAERSRQQSREWAAKQARKRMTVSSLRDVKA
ncbi:hypothetical protein F5X96DRAFT_617261 [Biscogniauxia mediterranea]|nr:hypothetical protein F5X96DRAFT_617261 [Biscogniauxia mediterranea]